MPKRTTPAAPPAHAIGVSFEELLLIATKSAQCEPGDSHEAKCQRARSFVARLIGHLPDDEAIQLALAIKFPHLAAVAERLRDEVLA